MTFDIRSNDKSYLKYEFDLSQVAKKITDKLKHQLQHFSGKYPAACSIDGQYPLTGNTDWTTGFWSGMTGLAWKLTGDKVFAEELDKQVRDFGERLDLQHDLDTHDLGFLYSLSCVNAWHLSGNESARQYALAAADALISRYLPVARIIQAWGDLSDPQQQGRMIIDCLMNLPLLYWASRETGHKQYAELAFNHAEQAYNYLLRDDFSTFHTFYMDVHSGEPLKGSTHQGYADNSCWARGQAWAIYGFTLSYGYTGDDRFLNAARETAEYYLAHLPADKICYWDLALTEPDTHRDSSAAAIAACGLLELAKYLSVLDPLQKKFIEAALLMAKELSLSYVDDQHDQSGYLKHSVYNMNKKRGVDEYSTWGDYFFFELISRLAAPLPAYW
ncbi:glycoside hydrolase family 88 protein [Biostraticola tofi]|uniref:Unsaturated chondroitin disaccharide hydrolase n=1 Tax=Biostraticola tofi TaxID=466109 RepID=A0A4R3YVG6_9GAMM|nr:glycoside hydrolase family 88 protein [Biostraticola tofi]TCV95213.1 unsaturated chondroitin disaccharide hydrolase [Biostraticola tofi]